MQNSYQDFLYNLTDTIVDPLADDAKHHQSKPCLITLLHVTPVISSPIELCYDDKFSYYQQSLNEINAECKQMAKYWPWNDQWHQHLCQTCPATRT